MLKAILFDKDGTLIELGETWDEPSVEVVDLLLGRKVLSATERKRMDRLLGINESRTGLIPNSLFATGSIEEQADILAEYLNEDPKELAHFIESHYLNYIQHAKMPAKLMSGSIEVLKALAKDYILGVVTNDNRSITMVTLERTGLLDYMSFVACADDFGPKPKPDALHVFAQEYEVSLDEIAYVGDSSIDMAYGQLTQAAIGLAIDDAHLAHLEEADYIIRSLEELPEIIRRIEERLEK